MRSKGLAMISLIDLGYPYTFKNDLVYMVASGTIYSIRADFLLSLDDKLSLKDDNRIEEMLPSLYLHNKANIKLDIFEDSLSSSEKIEAKEEDLKNKGPKKEDLTKKLPKKVSEYENDVSEEVISEEDAFKEPISNEDTFKEGTSNDKPQATKPAGTKNLRQAILEEGKTIPKKEGPKQQKAKTSNTTKIEEFNLKDYSFNCFDLKLKDKAGNVVAKDVTVTTFLIDKKDAYFVAIIETTSASKRKYKSVFFCLKNKDIVVPIRLESGKKSCKVRISYKNIKSQDDEYIVSYEVNKNEGNKEIPSWKGIFAFPYSIKENSKGGVLVGKTKSGFETYQSDFKKGNITIKRKTPDGISDIEFNVSVSFIDNKVVLEMIN
jgi:hypothetical protein